MIEQPHWKASWPVQAQPFPCSKTDTDTTQRGCDPLAIPFWPFHFIKWCIEAAVSIECDHSFFPQLIQHKTCLFSVNWANVNILCNEHRQGDFPRSHLWYLGCLPVEFFSSIISVSGPFLIAYWNLVIRICLTSVSEHLSSVRKLQLENRKHCF